MKEGWGRIKISYVDGCVFVIAQQFLVVLEGARGGKRREVGLDFVFNLLFPAVSSHHNELVKGRCFEKW